MVRFHSLPLGYMKTPRLGPDGPASCSELWGTSVLKVHGCHANTIMYIWFFGVILYLPAFWFYICPFYVEKQWQQRDVDLHRWTILPETFKRKICQIVRKEVVQPANVQLRCYLQKVVPTFRKAPLSQSYVKHLLQIPYGEKEDSKMPAWAATFRTFFCIFPWIFISISTLIHQAAQWKFPFQAEADAFLDTMDWRGSTPLNF